MSKHILIVDDEEMIRELLSSALEMEAYECHTASNVDEALTLLGTIPVDLVISDIMMRGRSGVDLLRELKLIDKDIAVLMITGLSDMNTALECVHLGADDYITKPFGINRVILTVKNLMERRSLTLEKKQYQASLEFKVQEQTAQIRNTMNELSHAYDSTLTALVKALDAREKEVGSHSERVMNYAVLLGEKMGVAGKELQELAKGALLHDIGKIGISDNILLKPGPLDEREWLEMRRHPEVGYAILSEIDFLKGPADMILSHHERFDGSGYPKRLKGDQIPLSSRIFTLVDTLDAMTSDRPYRNALPFARMTAEIITCKGSQFDPEITDLFTSIPRQLWEECAGKRLMD